MHMTVFGSQEISAVPFIHLNLIPWIRVSENAEGLDVLNDCSLPCSKQLTPENHPEPCGTNINAAQLFLHNPL